MQGGSRMILLCGIASEPPLRMVIDAAEEMKIAYTIFHQRESAHSELCLEIGETGVRGTIRVRETDYALESFQGVYVRLMDHHDLPENRERGRTPADSGQRRKSALFHERFLDWLEVCDAKVMNRCSDMASNVSKPFQAQLIAAAGFSVPPTLISNEPDEVRAFAARHGRVIYKSISAVRSIVRDLPAEQLNGLEKVRNLPTQFQAFVPGVNIRVHVAGEELFATEIRTSAVDYRYAARDHEEMDMRAIDLPAEIADGCFRLSHRLRLPLCGIDLKRTPEGRYVCFEVNPSPGYSFFQEGSGQNIAGAIVRYLAS